MRQTTLDVFRPLTRRPTPRNGFSATHVAAAAYRVHDERLVVVAMVEFARLPATINASQRLRVRKQAMAARARDNPLREHAAGQVARLEVADTRAIPANA